MGKSNGSHWNSIESHWFSLDVHEIFMGFSLDLIGSDWGNLMDPIGIPLNPIGFHSIFTRLSWDSHWI